MRSRYLQYMARGAAFASLGEYCRRARWWAAALRCWPRGVRSCEKQKSEKREWKE